MQRRTVQISIDEFRHGDVPNVCAVTGNPTTQVAHYQSDPSGFRVWYLLLVVLGPIGWAALVLAMVMSRRPKVDGLLPMTTDGLDRQDELSRRQRWLIATPFVAATVLAGGLMLARLSEAAAAVLIVSAVVVLVGGCVQLARVMSQGLHIRAERNVALVTIANCHPDFYRAVIQRRLGSGARVDAF